MLECQQHKIDQAAVLGEAAVLALFLRQRGIFGIRKDAYEALGRHSKPHCELNFIERCVLVSSNMVFKGKLDRSVIRCG